MRACVHECVHVLYICIVLIMMLMMSMISGCNDVTTNCGIGVVRLLS